MRAYREDLDAKFITIALPYHTKAVAPAARLACTSSIDMCIMPASFISKHSEKKEEEKKSTKQNELALNNFVFPFVTLHAHGDRDLQ